MTGTTCVIDDLTGSDNNTNNNENAQPPYCGSMLDSDCILKSITRNGAIVLVPGQIGYLAEILELRIMCRENKEKTLVDIYSVLHWTDTETSGDFNRIGLEFPNIELHELNVIDSVSSMLHSANDDSIICRLNNYQKSRFKPVL